jgi:uncharacterized membrane protein YiaA
MASDNGKQDRATIMAAILIIFGIIIFTSSWWLPDDKVKNGGLYIYGFITVLLGIVVKVTLSSKN